MQGNRIVRLIVAGILLLGSATARADSQVHSATVLANDAAVGTAPWFGGAFPATVTMAPTGDITSNYLVTSGFGFTLPTNAVVLGIVAQIDRSVVVAVGSHAQDNLVRLAKGGSVVGQDRGLPGDWPLTNAGQVYGGLADLWGTTWSASDINSSNFGLAVSVTGVATSGLISMTPTVHNVTVTVTYYVPCPATFDFSGCDTSFEKASLKIDESKPGKEKLQASLKNGGALEQSAMGNLAGDSSAFASLCIYDGGDFLVRTLVVRGSGTCGDKPCWKSSGGDYPNGKGLSYKSKDGAQVGVTQIKLGGGDAGKSKGQVKADNKNGHLSLGTVAELADETAISFQIRTSAGMCLSATLADLSSDSGKFEAK